MFIKLLIGTFILIQKLPPSGQECFSEELQNKHQITYAFKCSNTNPESFLYDFVATLENIENVHEFNLEISNSHFVNIDAFLPPIQFSDAALKELALVNSSIEFIEDNAFDTLIFTSVLALSDNELRDLSFVKTLPPNLNKLYLDGNDFESVSNVFSNLMHLKYLDLSRCKISHIDSNTFSSFYDSLFVNLSKNYLKSFDVIFTEYFILEVDLSFNRIEYVKYNGTKIDFFGLNLSHNKIKSIDDIMLDYSNDAIQFLDLSFNQLTNVTALINKVYNLNIANSQIDVRSNLEFFKDVRGTVNLSGNNLTILTSFMFGKNMLFNGLNLFNCFISNINENAFNGIGQIPFDVFDTLNISSNPITLLIDYTFNNTRIRTIDLSNCKIKKIEGDAFKGLYLADALILRHNQISFISQSTFQNLEHVKRIDLAFNSLKKLDNNLFLNCKNLKSLVLFNSKIEVIRAETFNGTINLEELDLRNNLISAISFKTATIVEVVNLENNQISNLQFAFFSYFTSSTLLLKYNNITALKNNTIATAIKGFVREIDLSHCNIYNIESGSFRGLTRLEILNLRNNYLTEILRGTFVPLKKLIKLDLTGNRIAAFSSLAFTFGNQLSKLNITFSMRNLPSNTFIALNYLKSLRIINSSIDSLDRNGFKGLLNLDIFILYNVTVKDIKAGAFNGLDSLQRINAPLLFQHILALKRGTFEGLHHVCILDLSKQNITSMEPETFVGLASLKRLYLNRNNLKIILNNTFDGLYSLTLLNLSNNQISRLEPNAFVGLYSLLELTLCDNNITNLSLGTFQNFPYLEVLSLSKNNISKLLTGTFTNLKYLMKLDLSYNNITKLKMDNLFTLSNLQYLDLTGNHLIEIRHLELLKSLRHLESVGLNNNRWQCNNLASMLIDFQNYSINWLSSKDMTYTHENIDGIKCIDICKFFYCVDDYY